MQDELVLARVNTLALDIGTNSGFAVVSKGRLALSGTWTLASTKELIAAKKQGWERRLDIRFTKLYHLVKETIAEFEIERVVFEDVIFCTSQAQAQLWARLSGALWGAVLTAPRGIDVQCIPVPTLKSFATGHGNADKSLMAEALFRKFPGAYRMRIEEIIPKSSRGPAHENRLTKVETNTDMDDNEVDAIWLAEFSKAVDEGTESFSSIWERKKEAKRAATEKRKAKLARKQVL